MRTRTTTSTGRGCARGGENGAQNLTVVHTRDRKESETEAFVKPIQAARGVFFAGGRQWRLADAYLNTRVHRELQALLDRGGVIGGSSAGATILGSFLVRGDTKGNELMIGDHVEGMAFLKNSAIDQHLLRRNRQFDLIGVIEKHPALLGIGLDENTAIVVRGDEFDVIGQSYVVIYDSKSLIPPAGRFYFLAPGRSLRSGEARSLAQQPAVPSAGGHQAGQVAGVRSEMDLRTGCAFWVLKNGLLASYPSLHTDESADVAVLGAGITGALVAYRLTQAGANVVVLDKRDVASGSTAATTGLLQYETDTSLEQLAASIGLEAGVRVYRIGSRSRRSNRSDVRRGRRSVRVFATRVPVPGVVAPRCAGAHTRARAQARAWFRRGLASGSGGAITLGHGLQRWVVRAWRRTRSTASASRIACS